MAVAPSAIRVVMNGVPTAAPRALTEPEIEDVVARFVHAATVCKQVGFHGVEIHAAHGYLLSSFLSPLANVRDDAYGGSLQNRARLLLRIVNDVRQATGKVAAAISEHGNRNTHGKHKQCRGFAWL